MCVLARTDTNVEKTIAKQLPTQRNSTAVYNEVEEWGVDALRKRVLSLLLPPARLKLFCVWLEKKPKTGEYGNVKVRNFWRTAPTPEWCPVGVPFAAPFGRVPRKW